MVVITCYHYHIPEVDDGEPTDDDDYGSCNSMVLIMMLYPPR